MVKVLGIAGSPRKNGNTHILVNKILEGAGNNGAVTEIVFLNDLEIKECIGCLNCWKGKECSRKDDMNNLYPKIIESNIIVFGTPVYWYGPTAIMKAFIDRFVYFNCRENRNKIRNKSAVIAVPFEEDNMDTVEPVIDFFSRCFKYLELNFTDMIIAPGVGDRGEILKRKDYLDKAYSLGAALPGTPAS